MGNGQYSHNQSILLLAELPSIFCPLFLMGYGIIAYGWEYTIYHIRCVYTVLVNPTNGTIVTLAAKLLQPLQYKTKHLHNIALHCS